MPLPDEGEVDTSALEAEMEARLAEKGKEPVEVSDDPDPQEPSLEVSLEEPEKEDDGSPEKGEETKSRSQRRSERYDEMRRERDETRAEIERLKAEVSQLRQTPPASSPAPAPKDEYEEGIERTYRRQDELMSLVRSRGDSITQEEAQRWGDEAKSLERERARLLYRQEAARDQSQKPNGSVEQLIAMQNPDVMGNQNAMAFAEGYYRMETAKGRQAGQELLDEAFDSARVNVLKTSPRHQRGPSASDKARYAGMGRGLASGGGKEAEGRKSVRLSQHEIEMANVAFSHIEDPKERLRQYAKKVKLKQR